MLVVEDEPRLAVTLRRGLELEGFVVQHAHTGTDGLWWASEDDFDVIVLDIMLPDGSGLDLLGTLRAGGERRPILLLTALDDTRDRIAGLDRGADDYLGKPFDTHELLARVRALIRRTSGRAQPLLEAGDLGLDPATLDATWKGKALDLTRREFALLRLLMEQHGRPMSRETIQKHLYGWDEDVASNAVDVHVHQLRRKISPDVVRTVRGIGYAFGEPGQKGA